MSLQENDLPLPYLHRSLSQLISSSSHMGDDMETSIRVNAQHILDSSKQSIQSLTLQISDIKKQITLCRSKRIESKKNTSPLAEQPELALILSKYNQIGVIEQQIRGFESKKQMSETLLKVIENRRVDRETEASITYFKQCLQDLEFQRKNFSQQDFDRLFTFCIEEYKKLKPILKAAQKELSEKAIDQYYLQTRVSFYLSNINILIQLIKRLTRRFKSLAANRKEAKECRICQEPFPIGSYFYECVHNESTGTVKHRIHEQCYIENNRIASETGRAVKVDKCVFCDKALKPRMRVPPGGLAGGRRKYIKNTKKRCHRTFSKKLMTKSKK